MLHRSRELIEPRRSKPDLLSSSIPGGEDAPLGAAASLRGLEEDLLEVTTKGPQLSNPSRKKKNLYFSSKASCWVVQVASTPNPEETLAPRGYIGTPSFMGFIPLTSRTASSSPPHGG